jgi:hypothetical protein
MERNLIRWGLEAAIDKYYHIIRRRMNWEDTLENIEKARQIPESAFIEFMTKEEISRYNDYKQLLAQWQ